MAVYVIPLAIALLAIGAYLVLDSLSGLKNDRIEARLRSVASESAPPPLEPQVVHQRPGAVAPIAMIRRNMLLAEFAPRRRIVMLWGAAAVSAVAVVALVTGRTGAGAMAVVLAGAGAVVLRSRAVRRRRKFIELLPAFIERLHQMLGSGSSLANAFEKALDYSEPLVQAYLRPVAARLAHGATLAESLSLQGYRLGIPQLTMLSVIAHANMRFGGSIGEVLSHVVATLNDQLRVQRELDAMTAEMRSSAKVLIFLPIAVAAALMILNPDYLTFFVDDPQGRTLLTGASGLAALGIIVLRAMSRIEA